MYCANHFWISAVKRCQQCGKPLCHACIKLFYPTLCENCLLSRSTRREKNKPRGIGFIITVLIFFTAFFLTFDYLESSLFSSLLFATIIACTPLAWRILSQRPVPKKFSTGIRYIFYIIAKCMLSISLGTLIVCLQYFFHIKEYLFKEEDL